jgi:hypothetical protein
MEHGCQLRRFRHCHAASHRGTWLTWIPPHAAPLRKSSASGGSALTSYPGIISAG